MPRPAESIAQIPTKMVNGMAKNTEIEQNGHSQSETHSRPPVIEEDLWEMERRKRVREVLGADDFRSELEQIVHPDFAKSFPEDLNFAVPPIGSLPRSATFGIQQQLPTLPALNVNQVLNTPPIPIADLPRNCPYSAEERRCRNKLATFYRLVDLFQWSQGIYNHITLRLPGTGSAQILINPFGLLYHEVTAGSLIKLNLAGDVLDQGSTNLGVNQAAYVLHSAIHEARPDVHCVLHLHTAVVSAVGCMKCGLLPICQEAMIIGPVGYHDYQGILTDEEEKKSIVRDLGDKNVLMLRNHGFVACGQSVEDAMHLAFHMVVACETQILILLDTASFICCGGSAEEVAWTVHNLVVACQNQIRAARAGIENLIVPSTEAVQKAYTIARRGGGGVNRIQQESGSNGSGTIPWGIGELEWEAWCRALDTAGFCTGHLYRNAQLRHRLAHSHHSMHNLASTSSSVATPSNGPASMGLAGESEAAAAWRLSMLRKERERTRWLNSPCQYEKVQLLETGTAHPRLITKWVEQGSASATRSSSGTPVKIDSPHQFSPCNGADSREFRERQRRLKEVRMSGTCSPGPKSQVLEGTTLEHGERPFNGETKSHQAAVYIGTASKGIIQREHQINAQVERLQTHFSFTWQVYRQLYAPNPFIGHSEQDLKQYLKEVGGKCKGKCAEDNNTITGVSSLPSSPSFAPPVMTKMPESPTMGADRASLMQAVARVKMNGKNGLERSASGDDAGKGTAALNNGRSRNGAEKEKGLDRKPKKQRRGIFFFSRKKNS